MTEPPVVIALERPIRTSRLVLRTLDAADAEALHGYRSLPEVARYVPFEPMTPEVIAERLEGRWRRSRISEEGDGLIVGFERVDTGELIGDLALMHVSSEHRGWEIGWLLHPGQGGHGYATEAAQAGLGLMFAAGAHRVVARVDARNTASLRLCERLGMRREAYLVRNEWFKGEWSDEIDYALLVDEWASSSSGSRSAIESTIRDAR